MQQMKKVSIVIPVYNVERYLHRCLNSVINQTYQNLEIILVDDGSTDNSGKICDEYAVKDNRVVVVHKENGGLSDARNVGIERIHGEYLAFIDSDDFVSRHYVQGLLDALLECQADIAFCRYLKVLDNDGFKTKPKSVKLHCFSSDEMLKNWHGKYKHIETMAWNKLYYASLFTNSGIRYPKGYYNEDVQTTHLLVNQASKIVITNQILYYYVQRKDSIMGTITDKKVTDNIMSQRIRMSFFKNNNYEEAYERLFIKLLKYYILVYCKTDDKLTRKKLFDQYLENKSSMKNYKTMSIFERLLFKSFERYYGLFGK